MPSLREIAALVLLSGLVACASPERQQREQQSLLQMRALAGQRAVADTLQTTDRLLARSKAEHDAYASGRSTRPPSLDILVISGGGDWGALVRIVAVPDDWVAPVPGVFIKESMNALSDLGERMGADPASWRTAPP